jgi:hypothetical protein
MDVGMDGLARDDLGLWSQHHPRLKHVKCPGFEVGALQLCEPALILAGCATTSADPRLFRIPDPEYSRLFQLRSEEGPGYKQRVQ